MPHRIDNSPAGQDRAGLPARLAAAALIGKVVDGRAGLDGLVDDQTGLAAWRSLGDRDRALARAIAIAALRRRKEIDDILGRLVHRPPPKNARHLLHTLHAAAAQILYLNVPDSAAVNLAVAALSQDRRSVRFAGFANALLRRLSAEKANFQELAKTAEARLPAWLAQALIRDHGRPAADAVAEIVGREPMLDLTLHPRLGAEERGKLAGDLGGRELVTGTLRISDDGPVAQLPGYDEGKWWVQDAASSLPARLLGRVDSLTVADLCAAPGGKTAQLATAGAKVTAVELVPARMARLAQNLARLKLDAECITGDFIEMAPPRQFDAVLLDAPCSATGTIRRHPDVAWTKMPEDVAALASLQERMILAAARWLKPGGALVYANCSMLRAEGEEVVARVLARQTGLRRAPLDQLPPQIDPHWITEAGDMRTLPHYLPATPPEKGGLDGFYACRMLRD